MLQIAKIAQCSCQTICNWLKKLNIKARTYSEAMIGKNSRPLLKRFWDKVDVCGEDECWEWTASLDTHGYGQIVANNNIKLAHILSWELHHKCQLQTGYNIHHLCNNSKCVNPKHLCKLNKSEHHSLHNCGVLNKGSKLKEWQIIEIREKYMTGYYSQSQLAQIYKVSQTTIWRVVNRHNWSHV